MQNIFGNYFLFSCEVVFQYYKGNSRTNSHLLSTNTSLEHKKWMVQNSYLCAFNRFCSFSFVSLLVSLSLYCHYVSPLCVSLIIIIRNFLKHNKLHYAYEKVKSDENRSFNEKGEVDYLNCNKDNNIPYIIYIQVLSVNKAYNLKYIVE